MFSLPFGLELDFLKAIFLHYSCPRSRAPQRPQWNLARRVLLALRQAVKKPLLVKLSCGKTHPSGNPWNLEGYEWMVFDDCLFCWSICFHSGYGLTNCSIGIVASFTSLRQTIKDSYAIPCMYQKFLNTIVSKTLDFLRRKLGWCYNSFTRCQWKTSISTLWVHSDCFWPWSIPNPSWPSLALLVIFQLRHVCKSDVVCILVRFIYFKIICK